MLRLVLDASLGARLLQREEYVPVRLGAFQLNRIRRGDGCFSQGRGDVQSRKIRR